MKINCKNCQNDIEALLSSIPSKWRTQIAQTICKYIICDKESTQLLDCDDFKDCETVTSLSNFTIIDNILSITYKDERSVNVTRTLDFGDLMKMNLDPKCLTDQDTWDGWSYTEQMQAIIDASCTNCVCHCWNIQNYEDTNIVVQFVKCDEQDFSTEVIEPGDQLSFCGVAGAYTPTILSGNTGNVIVIDVGPCDVDCEDFIGTTTTTSTTTTTTAVPTTTSTTSTTTSAPGEVTFFYGFKGTNTVLNQGQIEAGDSDTSPTESDFIADYSDGLGTPFFFWFAEPSGQTVKTKWEDTINSINAGNIGTMDDLFGPTTIVGPYRFYISVYQTEQANPIKFKKI